jgi:hypothetical protein
VVKYSFPTLGLSPPSRSPRCIPSQSASFRLCAVDRNEKAGFPDGEIAMRVRTEISCEVDSKGQESGVCRQTFAVTRQTTQTRVSLSNTRRVRSFRRKLRIWVAARNKRRRAEKGEAMKRASEGERKLTLLLPMLLRSCNRTNHETWHGNEKVVGRVGKSMTMGNQLPLLSHLNLASRTYRSCTR